MNTATPHLPAQQASDDDSTVVASPADGADASAATAAAAAAVALSSAVSSSFTPSPLAPLSAHLTELVQCQDALLSSLSTTRASYYATTHAQMLALLPSLAAVDEYRKKVEDGRARLKEVRRRVDRLQQRMKAVEDEVTRTKHTAAVGEVK